MALPPQTPPEPLILIGRVVTFDQDQPILDPGMVCIGADEHIAAVQPATQDPPAAFQGARRVDTKGAIYPGLMDLHNHIAYNSISLWTPPNRTLPFETRSQWMNEEPSYDPMVGDPGKLLGYVAGKAQLKYAETKAIIGGVTAIQGSARTGHVYNGWLVRNIEEETFKTGRSTVFQSVIRLHNTATEDRFAAAREHMTAGNSFIYHLAEGSNRDKLVVEYNDLRDHDCVQAGLLGVHCSALALQDFQDWSPHHGTVVWSPFSNLWLYRSTTDVAAVRRAGLRLCLGADWSPSGSKSLLGELKVADLYNKSGKIDPPLTDQQLCEMATCNAADALSWSGRLGRLKVRLHGDVLVTTDREGDPYRNLITSTESDVMLVICNGYPMYGTPELMDSAGATAVSEPIGVGPLSRRIRLVYDWVEDADWSWTQVCDELEAARRDPRAYFKDHPHKPGGNVELKLDKPGDASKSVNFDATIPPLDSLYHDPTYLEAVHTGGFHGGFLDGLRTYYSP